MIISYLARWFSSLIRSTTCVILQHHANLLTWPCVVVLTAALAENRKQGTQLVLALLPTSTSQQQRVFHFHIEIRTGTTTTRRGRPNGDMLEADRLEKGFPSLKCACVPSLEPFIKHSYLMRMTMMMIIITDSMSLCPCPALHY